MAVDSDSEDDLVSLLDPAIISSAADTIKNDSSPTPDTKETTSPNLQAIPEEDDDDDDTDEWETASSELDVPKEENTDDEDSFYSDAEDDEELPQLTDPMHVRSTRRYIARDIQAFLLNYPNQLPSPSNNLNLRFYRNEIPFQPEGIKVDRFHEIAFGNHRLLEYHHGYIQWLFPIREQGLNYAADPLQLHEAEAIRDDEECQTRLLRSFQMMLDFYGMDFDEDNPLIITRHQDLRVCRQQYVNLMDSYHNYLRITRILKSLWELGQEDYVPSFLLFILAEQSQHDMLDNEALKSSMDNYWIYCMRGREAQHCVAKVARWVRDDGQFNMDVYQKMVERKQSTGRWEFDPEEEELKKVVKRRRPELGYNLRWRTGSTRGASLF